MDDGTLLALLDPSGQIEGGKSITPLRYEVSYPRASERPLYAVYRAGLDECRMVFSLSGDSARLMEELAADDNLKPIGMPGCRFVGRWEQDGYKRTFRHHFGDELKAAYHRQSANLHVVVKPEGLLPIQRFPDLAFQVRLMVAQGGVESHFPVRLARVDVTVDVIFASEAAYLRTHYALMEGAPQGGRVIAPHQTGGTVRKSSAARAGRAGRWYDKVAERQAHREMVGMPVNRYMRLEAEVTWSDDRPGVEQVTREWARETWLDRFGYVGSGSLTGNEALMDELERLLKRDIITATQYERLFTFLEHERLGRAERLYDRRVYLERMREARKLGLQVSGASRSVASIDQELDVRAMIEELALAL